MLLHLLAQRERLAVFLRHQLGHIGRRRRRRRAEQVLENPLAALHDRGAVRIRRDGQNAALAQQTATIRVGQRHAAELRPIDLWNAVVLGEAFVDERVVGRQQIEQAAILADDARDEQFGLLHERRSQRFVERKDHRIWRRGLDVAQMQPLPGEIRDERVGPRVGKHALHLLQQHRGISQPAPLREVEQLIVGNAAPQEKGQTRGQLDIAHRIGLAGREARRILFDTEEEIGRHEQGFERPLNAGVEVRLRDSAGAPFRKTP